MATSDLLAELSKDSFRAAPDVEKKVVAAVLRQLDDQSGDVSTLAVKCLPPLVKNCSKGSVADVVNGLVDRLCAEEGKDARAKRDAGVIGLKTVLNETPGAVFKTNVCVVVKTLVPKLVAKLSQTLCSGDAAKNTGAAGDVAGDCLDVLHAAAAEHGAYMTVGHDDVGDASMNATDGVSAETARELEAALVKYLAESGRPGTRKRAATCLASLGATAGDGFLARCASAARDVVETAVSEKKLPAQRDELCAPYVHMLGAMAHAAGARFGKHAAESLPCVVSLAAAAREEGSEALRETCLRTLERFAEECPRAVAPSLKEVVLESLKLVAHDPLYGDDDGAEDGADDMDADGDDDDDGSEYGSEYDASEYSDDGDDDASWKIRRGATRVLRAVSSKAPFVMEAKTTDASTDQPLFVSVVQKLVARGSRERDESCRLEAFAALEAALRAASPSRGASSSLAAAAAAAAPDVAIAASRWCSDASTTKDKKSGVKSTLKTRAAAFGVLTELALCVPAAFTSNENETETEKKTRKDALGAVAAACAGALVSAGVDERGASGHNAFADGSAAGISELRVAASRFACVAARFFAEKERSSLLTTLAPPLVAATRDAYYKTAAEAFSACEALVPAFALALGSEDDGTGSDPASSMLDALVSTATSLVSAAAEGVGAADRDAEVKAAATRCAGAACSMLAPFVSRDVVVNTVASLVERLGNEATRLGATKALSSVFASERSDTLSFADRGGFGKSRQGVNAVHAPSRPRVAARRARRALLAGRAPGARPRRRRRRRLVSAFGCNRGGRRDRRRGVRGRRRAGGGGDGASLGVRRASTRVDASVVRGSRARVCASRRGRARQGRVRVVALRRQVEKSRPPGLSARRARRARVESSRASTKKGVVDTPRSLRDALRFFFGHLVASGQCDHTQILELLLQEKTETTDANGDTNASLSLSSRDAGAVAIAECAASACASAGGNAVADAAKELVTRLEAEKEKGVRFGYRSRLAMYCLGELARLPPRTSVASSDDANAKDTKSAKPGSKKKQKKAPSSSSEKSSSSSVSAFRDDAVASTFEALVRDAFETRAVDESFLTAAAFALGGACAGVENRARFLPVVIDGASNSSSDQRAAYAFLVSAREAVDGFSFSSDSFFTETETQSLVECLLRNADSAEEEGARAVVAECLGRLAARDENAALVRRLEADANDASASAGRRATAVDAAKHALVHASFTTREQHYDLLGKLPGFVNDTTLASNTDARTRVAAMRCLSAAAHADADALVSERFNDWIAKVAPCLFAQTPVDTSLVRVVDLGPFKHTVDDGLETRKAAFECLATLLDAFRTSAEAAASRGDCDFLATAPSGFANGVATAAALGSKDHYDVKIVAHGLVCALASKGSVLGTEALRLVLPDLCVAFRGTLLRNSSRTR
jgi:cullin-associated NEDD8-dissociated protein 1